MYIVCVSKMWYKHTQWHTDLDMSQPTILAIVNETLIALTGAQIMHTFISLSWSIRCTKKVAFIWIAGLTGVFVQRSLRKSPRATTRMLMWIENVITVITIKWL